jgi:uncharacterized membrane protein
MTTEDRKHLFVLSFPDRAGADAAVNELTELQRDQFLEVKDHAIISKGADGTLTIDEDKEVDPGARRGMVTGGLGGAFIALAAGPIGLGAVAVGMGIGAVTSALRDSGFKNDDMQEVGRLMEGGRSILLLAVRPQDTERLQSVLNEIPEFRAADRRWETDVDAGSKNVLRDAIEQYKAQEADAVKAAEKA